MAPIQFRTTMVRPLRDWRLWGILPKPTDIFTYRVYSVLVHSIIWIFLTCFVLSPIEAQGFSDIIIVVNFATTLILAYVKAACLRYNWKKFNVILSLMDQLDTTETQTEQDFLIKAEVRAQMLYTVMTRFCLFSVSVYVIPPLINGELMFPALYPFDPFVSRLRYYMTFLFQSVCNNFIVLMLPSIDTYGPAMWFFLTAYIDILLNRLERLGSKDESRKVCEVKLTECVKYHSNLLM